MCLDHFSTPQNCEFGGGAQNLSAWVAAKQLCHVPARRKKGNGASSYVCTLLTREGSCKKLTNYH